jgi:hypothetical protein
MISKYSVMHNHGIGKDIGPYLYIYIYWFIESVSCSGGQTVFFKYKKRLRCEEFFNCFIQPDLID